MRISLSASSSSFIYFFLAIPRYPQSSALFRLPCTNRRSRRNQSDMNVFYSDSKTDLQLGRDSSIKFHPFKGAQDVVTRLDGCTLRFTTPQPLQITPALQEACLWGHTIGVNNNLCGYLRFLSIGFVRIIWVQYATDNLSDHQLEFAS
jgi:hypothetical protein